MPLILYLASTAWSRDSCLSWSATKSPNICAESRKTVMLLWISGVIIVCLSSSDSLIIPTVSLCSYCICFGSSSWMYCLFGPDANLGWAVFFGTFACCTMHGENFLLAGTIVCGTDEDGKSISESASLAQSTPSNISTWLAGSFSSTIPTIEFLLCRMLTNLVLGFICSSNQCIKFILLSLAWTLTIAICDFPEVSLLWMAIFALW